MALKDWPRTPCPNRFLDHWLGRLRGSEWVALMFITRRTLGEGLRAAPISYQEFMNGTPAADGGRHNQGCRIRSAATLKAAITALEGYGLVHAERRCGMLGEPLATVYKLILTPEEEDELAQHPIVPTPPDLPGRFGPAKRRRQVAFTGKRAWAQIKADQDYRCAHCGRREPEITLTRDHIIATTRNGPNVESNIQALCRSCNSRKNNRMEDD